MEQEEFAAKVEALWNRLPPEFRGPVNGYAYKHGHAHGEGEGEVLSCLEELVGLLEGPITRFAARIARS